MGVLIEARNLSFEYVKSNNKCLKDVNFSIEEGDFALLFGRSASGKSTLLKHFKKPLIPRGNREGKVYFLGENIDNMSDKDNASKIGYVFQNPDEQIVTDTVMHELVFGLESLGEKSDVMNIRASEIAGYFGISSWLDKDIRHLSGGQKQLVNLASVMIMRPKMLILDEPTAYLDPISADKFLRTLRKMHQDLGITVLIAEHRLNKVLQYASKILYINKGSLKSFDTTDELADFMLNNKDKMATALPDPLKIAAYMKAKHPYPITALEGKKYLNNINPDKVSIENNHSLARDCKPALEAKEVCFRYEKDGADILNDFNMTIKKGSLCALMGDNGCGKSTALSILSRIYMPYRGKITVLGKKINTYSSEELYKNTLAYLTQEPIALMSKDTVFDELLSMNDEHTARLVASYVGIDDILDMHPYDLSQGQLQLVSLAKIILLKPRILFLDEPTKGMDGALKEDFAKILSNLKSQQVAILMVTHDIDFVAEYADECAFMFQGKIAYQGSPREFFSQNYFYTTLACAMSKDYFEGALTAEEVLSCLKKVKTI